MMEDERHSYLTRCKGFSRSNALLLSNKNKTNKEGLLIKKVLNEEAKRRETLALNLCSLTRGFEPVCILALSLQNRHSFLIEKLWR